MISGRDKEMIDNYGLLFIGGGVTLIGKIIFDWLKNRRNGDEMVTKEICDIKHNNVEQTLTDIKTSQIKIFDKIDDIYKFMPKRNSD